MANPPIQGGPPSTPPKSITSAYKDYLEDNGLDASLLTQAPYEIGDLLNSAFIHLSKTCDTCIFNITQLFGAKFSSTLKLEENTTMYSPLSNETKGFIANGNILINGAKANIDGIPSCINSTGPNDLIYTFKLLEAPKESFTLCIQLKSPSTDYIRAYLFVDADKTSAKMLPGESSFAGIHESSAMLLKTNPKLTGNAKLVVSSDYRLFLDTFKATSILNSNNFRHQEISYQGNYPIDIKRVFRKLPKGELYKFPVNAYDPHKAHTKFSEQNSTMYQYGAEVNDDSLYTESLKILAPLQIKSILPDFFAIFRVDDACNNADMSILYNDADTFKRFLRDSKVVKIFDLRKHTTIGAYLNNYASELSTVEYPIYLQFLEQDRESADLNNKFMNGTNSYVGISIDKGVITKKQETSYFANKIISDSNSTQFEYDMFIASGFERNNLIYPYIINLEFLFDDEDADNFSMHRYFGLYLKCNDFASLGGMLKDEVAKTTWMIDEEGAEELYVPRLLEDITGTDHYKERIVFGLTETDSTCIKTLNDYKQFISNVTNSPGECIGKCSGRKIEVDDEGMSYVTINFDKQIKYGEHFRIVTKGHKFKDNSTGDVVLEIIASNDHRLAANDNCISENYTVSKRALHNEYIDEYFKYRTMQAVTEYNDTNDNAPGSGIISANANAENSSIYSNISDDMTGYGYLNDLLRFSTDDDMKDEMTYSGENTAMGGTNIKNGYASFDSKVGSYLKNYDDSTIREYPLIARIAFYTQDVENPDEAAQLETQIARLAAAVAKFNFNAFVGDANENSISIVSVDKECYIEHISADILNVNPELKDNDILDFSVDCGEDILRYFGMNEYPALHYLNFDSKIYGKDYVAFAPIDFEILGHRLHSIAKFKVLDNDRYFYEIEKDSIIPLTKGLLGKSPSGYSLVEEQEVNVGYVYANDKFYDTSSINSLVYDDKKTSSLQSPFNLSRQIISSNVALSIRGGEMSLHMPLKFSFSLMGIHPIKSFAACNGVSETKTLSNAKSISKAKNERVYIGTGESRIKRGVVYKLKKGTFLEANIPSNSTFIIDNERIFFNQKTTPLESASTSSDVLKNNGPMGIALSHDYLTCASDVLVEEHIPDIDAPYNEKVTLPIIQSLDFFKDKKEYETSMLMHPACYDPQISFESIGEYYDTQKRLLLSNLRNDTQKNTFSGHVNSIVRSGAASIDSFCNDRTYLDELKDGSNIIYNLLTQSFSDAYNSKSYYNSYTNNLETILAGVKVNINFTAGMYAMGFRLQDYGKFDVYLVTNDNAYKNDMMIVSMKERAIMFILNSVSSSPSNWSVPSNMAALTRKGPNRNLADVKYLVKNADVMLDINRCFGNNRFLVIPKSTSKYISIPEKSNLVSLQNASNIKDNVYFYLQWNGNDKEYKDYLKVEYMLSNGGALITSLNMLTSDSSKINSSNAQIGFSDESEFLSYVTAMTMGKNDYESLDAEKIPFTQRIADAFNSIINMDIHIVDNQGKHYSLSINEDYSPISISASVPNKIKFNSGYFDIELEDIASFDMMENELIQSQMNSNFTKSNTSLSNISKIKSLTYNKIYDSSNKIVTVPANFIFKTYASIFSSDWDPGFYRLYSNDGNSSTVDGYKTGCSTKTFMGSRCINVKRKPVKIEEWKTSVYSHLEKGDIKPHAMKNMRMSYNETISLNVTNAFISKMLNDETFISNWTKNINNVDKNWIINYIKNSLAKMYKIDDEVKLTVYSIEKDSSISSSKFIMSKPENLDKWKKETNISSSFRIDNDDLIMTLSVSKNDSKTYYPVIEIERI